ncbi:MAG: glucose-1-phosphate cytidylyltransferase [Deferribacterales bacterium]
MKVVILAGGFGTRLSEETDIKPKPMVEIGGKPILWHIMKIYSSFGFNEFVICLGYKGYTIKEYFAHYFIHNSDVTFDFSNNNERIIHTHNAEPWKVTLVDTGINTMTGGRVKRVQPYIGDEPFMLTYGDGVADIDINEVIKFHKSHGKAITMSSSQPDGRFGAIDIEDNKVTSFLEKPKGDGTWINIGFFICEPKVFDYIKDGDATIFEKAPLEHLAKDEEMYAYKHRGFWKPMDTLRDKIELQRLWDTGTAPWKLWK